MMFWHLQVVMIALSFLALPFQQATHTGSVWLAAEEPVALFARSDGAIVIVTNVTSDGPCRLRVVKADGSEILNRYYDGHAVLAHYSEGPIGIVMRSSEDWSVGHFRVIDLATGGIKGTVRVPLTSNASMSAAGDAVVYFSDPDHQWSPLLTVRAVGSERARTLGLSENVGAAAAVSYERVFVMLGSGRLEAFNGDSRLWSVQGPGNYSYIGLAVSRDGGTVFVGELSGRFRIYDGQNGDELFRYDTGDPEKTLRPLGLFDRAASQVSKLPPERSLTTGQAMSRVKARLTPAGHVLMVDLTDVLGGILEFNPRTLQVENAVASSKYWQALAAAGFANAEDRARVLGNGAKLAVSTSRIMAAAIVGDSVLIVRLR